MSELEPAQNDGAERGPEDAVDDKPGGAPARGPIFAPKPDQRAPLPLAAWTVAALIVVAIVCALLFAGRKKPAPELNTLQAPDAYATELLLTQFAMSESSSLSGGKLTYLDGHIRNSGERVVNAVTVQVVFLNDEGLAPQIHTLPLALIRRRQPYIDIEPVSAEPLKPGDDREFRLIFERVPANWNTQMPEVRVIETNLQ